MTDTPSDREVPAKQRLSDAEQAVRYLAIKAAIFILLPAVIAVAVAVWVLV